MRGTCCPRRSSCRASRWWRGRAADPRTGGVDERRPVVEALAAVVGAFVVAVLERQHGRLGRGLIVVVAAGQRQSSRATGRSLKRFFIARYLINRYKKSTVSPGNTVQRKNGSVGRLSTGRSAGSARAERNPPTSFRFSPVLPQAANPCVTASAGLLTCSSFCAFPAAGPVADCRTSDARRAPELTATGIVADSHCVPF